MLEKSFVRFLHSSLLGPQVRARALGTRAAQDRWTLLLLTRPLWIMAHKSEITLEAPCRARIIKHVALYYPRARDGPSGDSGGWLGLGTSVSQPRWLGQARGASFPSQSRGTGAREGASDKLTGKARK